MVERRASHNDHGRASLWLNSRLQTSTRIGWGHSSKTGDMSRRVGNCLSRAHSGIYSPSLCKVMQNGNGQRQRQLQLVNPTFLLPLHSTLLSLFYVLCVLVVFPAVRPSCICEWVCVCVCVYEEFLFLYWPGLITHIFGLFCSLLLWQQFCGATTVCVCVCLYYTLN